MSKIIWITCCITFTLLSSDTQELNSYTSRRPLCNSIAVATCGILHTMHEALCGSHIRTQSANWFDQQIPQLHNDTVQWLGHATTLIKTRGYTILTDPVFWGIPAHTRYVPLGIHPAWLPEIDIILISHNHYDHLNKETLRYIFETQHHEPHVLCPEGVENTVRQCGYQNVTAATWWQTCKIDPHHTQLSISCVPAHHWSGRSPCTINQSLWAGWIIHGNYQYYFAGDTAYNYELFRSIKRFAQHIDLSLLPIGPCTPEFFTRSQHMHPYDLMSAIRTLETSHAIPIHWGTFKFGPDQPEEPIYKARDVCAIDKTVNHRLHTLTVGSMYKLRHRNQYDMPRRTSSYVPPLQSRQQ